MPNSPLENLVKILNNELKRDCDNGTVIGGLGAYSQNWQERMTSEARKPEQVLLAEEIGRIMREYDSIDSRDARRARVRYMLDRILGRKPVPDALQARLEELRASFTPPSSTPPKTARSKPHRSETPRQDPRERKELSADTPRSTRPRPTQSGKRDAQPPRPQPVDDAQLLDSFGVELKRLPQGELDLPSAPKLLRPPRKRMTLEPQEAARRLDELAQPVATLKGIGKKTAEALAEMGIVTVLDMVYNLPRRYDDYTQLLFINQLRPDTIATVIGKVTYAQTRVAQSGRRDFFVTLEDATGKLAVTFFGMHYLAATITVGKQLVVSGKVGIFRQQFQMANPQWEFLDTDNLHTMGIIPVYPLKEGVKPRALRRAMKQAIETWAERVPDYVPFSVLERCNLGDLGWTLKNLHFPESFDHLHHARRRFVFDQLLLVQLTVLANRRAWQQLPAPALQVDDAFLEAFLAQAFPYTLTGAQQRALADIRRDIAQTLPMNRLLQGDVGAGKTAVALAAMGIALANGKQAALMAPTSILAEQHYRGVEAALARVTVLPQRPVVALLTSALADSEREAIYRGIADGSIDLVIGTHALIQEGVQFKHLAVAVVDEQHRFGVNQRAALRDKGESPHLLGMTATPIPRTLALTLYADFDLSILDEKPSGRLPIVTTIHVPSERERVYSFVEEQLKAGRQAFIAHPLVEASDRLAETRSAVEAFEELKQVFFRYRVCLLHGQMRPDEKEAVMGAFARHEYDVMVTTTVAEVGVDVPNATVMVVESANRFGLAQLHQLRGRVGRGQHASFCLLLAESGVFSKAELEQSESLSVQAVLNNPGGAWTDAQRRLLALAKTEDGFLLSEFDWRIRGAGDLLGTRQSGAWNLRLAEFVTPELVELALQEARTLYEADPLLEQPEHHLLAQRVALMRREASELV